jgi:hypothetical protein
MILNFDSANPTGNGDELRAWQHENAPGGKLKICPRESDWLPPVALALSVEGVFTAKKVLCD